jgi:hypothetical protein
LVGAGVGAVVAVPSPSRSPLPASAEGGAPRKWRSRREVVDWLSSLVSGKICVVFFFYAWAVDSGGVVQDFVLFCVRLRLFCSFACCGLFFLCYMVADLGIVFLNVTGSYSRLRADAVWAYVFPCFCLVQFVQGIAFFWISIPKEAVVSDFLTIRPEFANSVLDFSTKSGLWFLIFRRFDMNLQDCLAFR